MLLAIVAAAFLFRQARFAAIAGMACYGLSYAFSTAWTLVPGDYAIEAWQGGMVAVLVMYVAFARLTGVWHAGWLLFVPLVLTLQAVGIDRHLLEFIVKAAIAGAVLLTFLKISINETLGKMVWAAVFVAEGWAVVEKLVCPYLPQPYEASSQCGRVVGSWEPFMVTGSTAVALAGIGTVWLITRTRKI
jgi:hypothetical protein